MDAISEGIGDQGISSAFQSTMASVRIFLGFVLGLELTPVRPRNDWVCETGQDGRLVDCTVRPVGYVELDPATAFPTPGDAPPVERRAVVRPGLGQTGIWPDMTQEWVPDDIDLLWAKLDRLPAAKRDQLLHAGNAYQIARSMYRDQRTACATYLVVACETLKPPGKRNDHKNVYDVVAELMGRREADRLKTLVPSPQRTRSRHVHRGELGAGELLPRLMFDDFADPSFDEMIDALWLVTRICLIEWLRREP